MKRGAARRMFGPVGHLRAPAAGMAGPAQVAVQLMLLEAVSPWPRKIQEGWEKSLPTSSNSFNPIFSNTGKKKSKMEVVVV